MNKKQPSKKKSKSKDIENKSGETPINVKTEYVNGLGASAEFTSVD